jgi:ketosteroid isomerase-like protein
MISRNAERREIIMSGSKNIETIKNVYAAFGRGDVSATDDGDVLTVVRYTARSRETGKAATMEIHHWFRFTNGKISRYRGSEDTIATASTLK